jgi:hypothetical protein
MALALGPNQLGLGLGLVGDGLAAAALATPLGYRLLVPWWRGKVPPLHYIKEGTREREDTSNWPCASSPLPGAPPPPPLSLISLSRGLRKGCAGVETTPPLHVIVLQSFQIPSEAIYFYNLNWIGDFGGRLDHPTCVSMRRCCHLWHQSHWTKFVTTLRSSTSATSSTLVRECNPRIWSCMLPNF